MTIVLDLGRLAQNDVSTNLIDHPDGAFAQQEFSIQPAKHGQSNNFPRDQTFPGAVGFSPIQAKTFQEIQKNCREIQKTFPGQLASQPVGVGKRENRVWNRGQVGGKQALKVGGKGALRNTQLRRFSIVLSYPPPPPPRHSFSRHVSHQLKLTLNDKGDSVAVVGGGGGGQQQRQQKTYI